MKLVITISRRYGTGASSIAAELADRLGIPVYNKDSIEHALEEHGYETESEMIRELADKPCIILGRCACDILRDRNNILNIFVTAKKEDRIRRVMEKYSWDYDQAKEFMEENDRDRSAYFYEHTGRTWGDVNDYHLILDTSEIGIDNCADVLYQYLKKLEYI
jgi:cytidylate kinase